MAQWDQRTCTAIHPLASSRKSGATGWGVTRVAMGSATRHCQLHRSESPFSRAHLAGAECNRRTCQGRAGTPRPTSILQPHNTGWAKWDNHEPKITCDHSGVPHTGENPPSSTSRAKRRLLPWIWRASILVSSPCQLSVPVARVIPFCASSMQPDLRHCACHVLDMGC